MNIRMLTGATLLGLMLGSGAMAAPRLELGAASGPAGGRLLEIHFSPPAFVPAEAGGGVQIQLEDAGWIGLPGAPDLPSVQELLELPDRSGVSLRLVEGDWEILPDLQVMPCQERLATGADFPLSWLRDEALYATDAFWPASIFELAEPALMRNQRVAKASFFPVQVNPVTGEARVWSRMVFELSFPGTDPRNARTFTLPSRKSSLDRMLARQVVRTQGEAGELEDLLFDRGPLPGKYVVIAKATAAANPSLVELLNWKRKKGHTVVVVTDSDVAFNATAIRARIVTEYNSADPAAFVLLVGDVDGDYALPTDPGQYDHFYATVDGTDILGDVAVGRLSAGNSAQLTTVCNKILQYESTPYVEDAAWLNRAGFTVGSSACHLSMKILSRGIGAEMVERRGYTTIDSAFCSGSTHVADWFVEGLSFYNYRGWVGMDGLSTTEIMDLAQGPRTPVATIFTCGTGDFNSGDDFTEAFLLAGNASTPGGAVASLGFATLNTHTRYNNVIVGGYYSGLLEYDAPEVGACLLQGKYDLYRTLPPSEQGNAANFAYWGNLMGDPGTSQWAGEPSRMNCAIPGSLTTGANHLNFSVNSDGQPVEGAVVCLWQDQAVDLQVRGLTDADGHLTLSFSGLTAGTLHATITHPRHVPQLSTLTVSSGTANPALTSVDTGGGLLPNGVAQPVSFTLTNLGSAALGNLNISATLDAAYGVVSNPGLTLATLAPGASHTFSGLSVTPVSDLADGTLLPILLQVACSQGTFPLLAEAPVTAPLVVAGTPVPISGTLEPGSTLMLRFPFSNPGSLAGTGVELLFTPILENALVFPSSPVLLGNLGVGESAPLSVTVSALASVNRGQPVPVRVDWTSHGGSLHGSAYVVVTVGGVPNPVDPTGPDAYGYWAYEDQDNSPQAAEYAWYAISAPEGGPGTEVVLNDNANEQDAGRWVDLPFPFTYYGRTYTRAAVCSNGFISFDEGGFGEWDFRNHIFPTGMGPDAMIAPMWDDHLTTGTTRGVWSWHDTAAHAFVISWYNLSANSSGGPNTFQLVLYDPAHYPTQTGDGPFKFQYNVFNDTQASDTDFPHCSIGFKDHSSTQGLTLRHWTQFPGTMHTVAAGRAIYITTPGGPVDDTHPPSILVSPLGTIFAGETVTVQATITDYSGIASAVLDWRLNGGAWNSLPLTQSGSSWSALIPGAVSGATVEFFITAVDASEHANSGSSSVFSYAVHSLIFADGFNGASSFTHQGGGGLTDQWHLESARAYEGTQCWKFGGSDTLDYANSAGGELTSPVMTLPANCTGIQASLQSWLKAESSGIYPDSCYDGGQVHWRLNGGSWALAPTSPSTTHHIRWTTATSAVRSWLGFPLPLFSGVAGGWSPIVLDVPDGTTSVQVRLLFGTDTGTTREGWYVDDFRLTAVLPAGQLPVVGDLSAVAANNQIFLDWSPVAGAISYRVYENTEAYEGSPVLLGETGSTSWQLPQTGARKFYTVRVVY